MKKVDIKEKVLSDLENSGLYYLLGYMMHKTTKLDKDKCLEYVKVICDKKINEVGEDFVRLSNNSHKLSDLSNEDLLKDNDKIIKG